MNGSLRLRATIARRLRERAGSRRAGRANRADGIAAIVVHIVQAVISAAIALSTSMEHTSSRRQLSGWEHERVLALTPLHFDQRMSRFSDAKFTRLYRLSKLDFSSLLAKLHPTLARTHTRPEGSSASVPVPIMVAITLRYLAGGQILDIGWSYGVADSTAYQVVDETLAAMNYNLGNIIFPATEEECKAAADGFQSLRGCPWYGVISALDGIAVAIHCPRLSCCPDPRKYYNRKGFYALSIQECVSFNYKIIFVSAKHAGSTHNSTAFISTPLHTLLDRSEADGGLPDWASVAADNAYGNGSACGRVLTPFPGALSSRQEAFNYYLSSLRILVEQVLGVIVGRWGILWSPMRCTLKKATRIVVVVCKLRNFIIDQRLAREGAQATAVEFLTTPADADNHVAGAAEVHIQDILHYTSRTSRATFVKDRQPCERD
jgi:DDE superfamily endonuclease